MARYSEACPGSRSLPPNIGRIKDPATHVHMMQVSPSKKRLRCILLRSKCNWVYHIPNASTPNGKSKNPMT